MNSLAPLQSEAPPSPAGALAGLASPGVRAKPCTAHRSPGQAGQPVPGDPCKAQEVSPLPRPQCLEIKKYFKISVFHWELDQCERGFLWLSVFSYQHVKLCGEGQRPPPRSPEDAASIQLRP